MPKLINMKMDDADRKNTALEAAQPTKESGPAYPWGLSINLEKESLDKLGIDLSDYAVGDKISLVADCYVKSLRQSESYEGNYQEKSMEIQLTDMAVEKGEYMPEDENAMGWDEPSVDVDRKLRRMGY